jgi:hypothetical protein
MGTTTPAELGATTRAVADWLGAAVGGAELHVAPSEADGVHVNLLAIQRAGAAHSAREGAVRFRLDYLVSCVDRAEPMAALDRLGRLVSALTRHPDWSLETLGSDVRASASGNWSMGLELWRALGLAPRPAVLVGVPWVVAHEGPPPAPPAERLDLQLGPTRSLAGRVIGVGRGASGATLRAPLPGARVALPDLGKSTTTDHEGRFSLAGIVARDGFALHVAARGQRQVVRIDVADAEPLEIEFILDGVLR